MVVRKVGAYVYPAVFTLLWAELLGLQMLNLKDRPEIILCVVSFTALALNVVTALAKPGRWTRALKPLAVLLSIVPVFYGVLLHLRATNAQMHQDWPYVIGWGYVAAMFVAAVACRIGAFVYRNSDSWTSSVYLFLTATASMIGA